MAWKNPSKMDVRRNMYIEKLARDARGFLVPMAAARLVRRERYAWPGGYEMALVMQDGGLLCFQCVEKEWRNIARANRDHALHRAPIGGWEPAGLTHAAECDDLTWCDHCGRIVFGEVD